jgi:hypothetical protein
MHLLLVLPTRPFLLVSKREEEVNLFGGNKRREKELKGKSRGGYDCFTLFTA